MTQSFPSSLAGPTSKERKYDRQLRLWAASGQQALEESRVLLVNSDGPVDSDNAEVTGVVGVETLKNLVLPGIGGFTIVDPATVTEHDLGVNFFLDEDSLGKSRAEETCKFLREMNPDVDGGSSSKSILELIKDENFLQLYRLIIITGPMSKSTLRTVSQAAKRWDTPLIYIHSVGFYSAVSLQLPSVFPIVETHPDPSSTQDLRLTNPWPALVDATRKVDNLDSLDDHQHGHVPYLLILLHFLEKWKSNHDGLYPQNYKEKSEFRNIVRAAARTNNAEGGEENFDEAVAAVLKSINTWSLSSGLKDVFEMDQCSQLDDTSDSFWIIASAIKTFYTKYGVLPLPGSLPDMKAQSADYIWLQNIYKSKAREDLAEVLAIVRATETQLREAPRKAERTTPLPISEKEIETFCKNAAHIKVIKGRDIPLLQCPDESEGAQQTIKTIKNNIGNPDSIIPIFIALDTLDTLVTEYQGTNPPPPQSSSTTYLGDSENWGRTLPKVLNALQIDNGNIDADDEQVEIKSRIESAAEEVRRAGAGELHNISALAGGFVAQEALKVLTRQYVPLDNTFLFDGVKCRGEMFRL